MQSAGPETISNTISANTTLPFEKSVWEVKFFLFFYYYLLGKRDFGYRIRLQPWKTASRLMSYFGDIWEDWLLGVEKLLEEGSRTDSQVSGLGDRVDGWPSLAKAVRCHVLAWEKRALTDDINSSSLVMLSFSFLEVFERSLGGL